MLGLSQILSSRYQVAYLGSINFQTLRPKCGGANSVRNDVTEELLRKRHCEALRHVKVAS